MDDVVLDIARIVSRRSTCIRRKVGAVLLNNKREVVSVGWNQEEFGLRCDQGQCPRGHSSVPPNSSYKSPEGYCVAVHAEKMAINSVLDRGVQTLQGYHMVTTCRPCHECEPFLKRLGVTFESG